MALWLSALFGGPALGVAFVVLWRRLLPVAYARSFWARFRDDTRVLLSVDDPAVFFPRYRALLGAVFAYAARNTAGMLLGLLPLAGFLLLLLPGLLDQRDRTESELYFHPPAAADVLTIIRTGPASAEPAAFRTAIAGTPGGRTAWRHAFCADIVDCALLASLPFSVHRVPADTLPSVIVVRPRHGGRNPLWPYLSDAECLFWLLFVVASGAMMTWLSRKDAVKPG